MKRWQDGSPQDANRILDLSSCGLVTLTKTKVWSVFCIDSIACLLIFRSFQILCHSAKIRRLNLSKNSLLIFPPEIWQLECLEEVIISHNQLSSISLPVVPGKGAQPALCFRLKTADLSFNAFTLFPEALLQLPKVMSHFITTPCYPPNTRIAHEISAESPNSVPASATADERGYSAVSSFPCS
jgi:Leucine-rich repeat (LRR) protein